MFCEYYTKKGIVRTMVIVSSIIAENSGFHAHIHTPKEVMPYKSDTTDYSRQGVKKNVNF